MASKSSLVKKARQISITDKIAKLQSFEEMAMHLHLSKLFSEIDKDAIVSITHGQTELGSDLVVIRSDPIRESIASVVVTMEHLRGETGKQIERILSQIKQCLDIPREISTRVNLASTTEVWLVIVGEITENARKRLRYQVKTEYKGTLTILDIEWLVKKFTSYYPEIFLGGETLDFVEERIDKLETKPSLSKKAESLNLSEWYVDPYVSTGGIPIEIDDAGTKVTLSRHRIQFRTLQSILKTKKRVIISGEPGVGKTTALSKYVLDLLKDISDSIVGGRHTGTVALPVIMSASDLVDCNTCESFIQKCIAKGQLKEGFGISTVIIDGLDEVLDEFRLEVIDKASKICSDMNWNLIIGTRKIEIIKNPPKGIDTFEMMPFEVNQALKLFDKIVQEGKLLSTLKEGLNKVITQLPMTPISLTILIEIAEEHGEVPASLADLYNRYFEMVLGKWDFKDKGIESLFQYETKLHFISELAWIEFKGKDNIEITRSDFDAFSKEYVKKFGFSHDWINRFISEIERAGLIEIGDMVSFKHRSFLDYFTGLYIFHHQDEIDKLEELISELYFSDLWPDVAFYYVGIRRALSQKILDLIMNHAPDDFKTLISKYTIGRLLQAGWLSTANIKYAGMNSALSYLIPLRDLLLESLRASKSSPGLIFADFLPMATSSWTMGSITLSTTLMRIYGELTLDETKSSYWKRISVISAIWKFLTEPEREGIISKLLSDIADSNKLNTAEKSTLLLLMITVQDRSKSITDSINRRLKRLIKRNPELFKKLLPPIDAEVKKRLRKRG